ncbi:phage tail assembly protein [Pantoea sp. YU22]|uniref:phage tail assembly protein n=1 Tax=Pantoea sp. YU22 TaxID=2497684 RepID=UPI002686511A|nr:phage tail assembly protein [Pantoea sp. YU22]
MIKKEVLLSKPIMAHGEKIHVLEMRPPTFDEIETHGFPFTITSKGDIKLDTGAALPYVYLLAEIPRSSAAAMTAADLYKSAMSVMGFFTHSEAEKTSGDDSTTPPISGA